VDSFHSLFELLNTVIPFNLTLVSFFFPLNSLSHYVKSGDIQTAAMLACVFGNKVESHKQPKKSDVNSSQYSSRKQSHDHHKYGSNNQNVRSGEPNKKSKTPANPQVSTVANYILVQYDFKNITRTLFGSYTKFEIVSFILINDFQFIKFPH